MRLLADESCDFAAVRALRAAGHDVAAVCDLCPGAEDSEVIRRALEDERLLLTEDKDFGELVFAHRQHTAGVPLLRYPVHSRDYMARTVVQALEEHGHRLWARFAVLEPPRLRIGGPRPILPP